MNIIEQGQWSFHFNNWCSRENRVTYTVCPNDPGIIYSNNFSDAHLIHEDGIKLVHLRQSSPAVADMIGAVDDPDFFRNLPAYLNSKDAAAQALQLSTRPSAQQDILVAIRDYHQKMMEFAKDVIGKAISAGVRNCFNGCANTPTGGRWHTDPEDIVISTAIEGAGTEYLIGPIGQAEAETLRKTFAQALPAHITRGVAQTGDILVMKGKNGGGNAAAASRAIFHRSAPAARRSVLLYGA